MKTQRKSEGSRVDIIQTVQTPLGFFVLVVLIAEAIFGIVAGLSAGSDRTYLIFGMLALIFLLVSIVSVIAVFRPEALYGVRPVIADQPAPEDTGNAPNEALPPFESIVDENTPVVISVDPAIGSVVNPGTTVFRVTFSKPMRKGWSFVRAVQGESPEVLGNPIFSEDNRTITAHISLRPDRSYAFWLNSARFRNFSGQNGKAAVPYFVYFRTSDFRTSGYDRGCSMHTDFVV